MTLVKANLWTASANSLPTQWQRTTAEAPHGRFITGSRLSVTYLQARCSLLTNSIMEGTALCSHWNQSLLKICLPGLRCLCQKPNGLTGFFIHHLGILPSIASQQESHFTANEVWKWACVHGSHWSCHVSQHPGAASLTEWWIGHLEY